MYIAAAALLVAISVQPAAADDNLVCAQLLGQTMTKEWPRVVACSRAILYEEDPADPHGWQFFGTGVWRVEQAVAVGQKPKVTLRGDIEFPERKMSVRLSMHRNADAKLPASHTVEIVFTLLPGFARGSIERIPGIMMKQDETSRSVALNGVSVKVADNFFLVGLSSADAEGNTRLLKERSWFSIPIVYGDGLHALIAIAKGAPGERAFAEAFAAWGQEEASAAGPP